ncbi:MAG TPA: FAD-binding oxidoreductase, partial [Anaerolineales bacterium]|nr:FAD-binding oxidoreductase [Anaerolineales bacterium]
MKKINLTRLGNFSNSLTATVYHAQPRFTEEIVEIFDFARKNGLKIAPRGAGRSYNDAALRGGGIVLDLSLLRCVQAWDSEKGILRAQPGLTL